MTDDAKKIGELLVADTVSILSWLVSEGRLTLRPDGSSYLFRHETAAVFKAEDTFVRKIGTPGREGTDYGVFARPTDDPLTKEVVLITTFTIGNGMPPGVTVEDVVVQAPDPDAGPRALAEGIMRWPGCTVQRWEDVEGAERDAFRAAYAVRHDAGKSVEAYTRAMGLWTAPGLGVAEFRNHWASVLAELPPSGQASSL